MYCRRGLMALAAVLFVAFAVLGADEGAIIGNYLGQPPPGLVPEPFARSVLPQGAYAGTFSPDLTEFYFNTAGPGGLTAISGLHLVDGQWVKVDFIVPYAFEPHISPTGDRMFYVLEDASGRGQGYVSLRTQDGWGEPLLLPSSVNGTTYFPMYFTSTLDGTLFWTRLSAGARLVSAPFAAGDYAPARNLTLSLNSRGDCSHPGVAPDGSYVLFDAELDGQADVYVSFATGNGGWSPATKVTEISSALDVEMAASVSPDGKYIFFVRMSGASGIYWVDAAVLNPYRP
jgi:hypothetical protein